MFAGIDVAAERHVLARLDDDGAPMREDAVISLPAPNITVTTSASYTTQWGTINHKQNPLGILRFKFLQKSSS